MKKKIASVVLLSVLFMGTVSASSVNGNYNGNPIVKVKVNGSIVDSEVPAQIIDGSTLLPLRAVSKALGADVKWNQDSYSVDLTPDKPATITNIKQLSFAADHYNNLRALGNQFYVTYLELYFALNDLQLRSSVERLNKLLVEGGLYYESVNQYNNYADTIAGIISSVDYTKINLIDSNEILISYYDSIQLYNRAIENMKLYSQSPSQTLFTKITTDLDAAFSTGNKGLKKSKDRYLEVYNTIQSQ